MYTNQVAEDCEHKTWEALCRRCGRCCFEKIEYGNRIYLTDIPCEYLNLSTNECMVYEQRSQKKTGCVAINQEIIDLGVLPIGCAYLQNTSKTNYKAPLSWLKLPNKVRKTFQP